jgi:hypothetical protein
VQDEAENDQRHYGDDGQGDDRKHFGLSPFKVD